MDGERSDGYTIFFIFGVSFYGGVMDGERTQSFLFLVCHFMAAVGMETSTC